MTCDAANRGSTPALSQLIWIGLLGLIAPLLFIALTLGTGITLESVLEPDKYVRTALGLLERGEYYEYLHGQWRPSLERLPGYPTVLALVFALFGSENYHAVALVQAGMVALTVVGIALCAWELDARWMWPAAALASICPNLAYRAATIMPETTFNLFFIWGLWYCLRAVVGDQAPRRLFIGGLLLASAFMTRPAMLLFPVFVYPGLVYLLKSSGQRAWSHSIGLALIPLLVIAGLASTQFYRTYQAHGHASFTVQSGKHAIRFLYPCLAKTWGCGKPDQETLRTSQLTLKERLAALSEVERQNPVLTDNLTKSLAIDLILDIPFPRLLSSISGSIAKLLLHTTYTEILSNFGLDPLFFSEISGDGVLERAKDFVKRLFSDPFMAPWPFIMAALLGSRLLQMGGLIGGLADPANRSKVLFLALSIACFLVTTIGIGNQRYRASLEPVLIILTVAGADMLWRRVQLWRWR